MLLEETPADPLQLDSQRLTSLRLAVQRQHAEVADVLLAHAADLVYSAQASGDAEETDAEETDLFLPRTGSLADENVLRL